MAKRIGYVGILCASALAALLAREPAAIAAKRQPQIFDTEIESTIRLYATPVLRAAGLDPEAVRIHLIRATALNAFVSRGQRLFVTTGLLAASEHPGQLIGVLAHETGHIAGGHLARIDAMLRDATTPALLSYLLGAALGVLSGDPAAVPAVIGGGQHVIRRNLLSFSRSHERSADRAAVSYLEATKQSALGLLEFIEILDSQQALIISRSQQQELSYDVTHPLTTDRIAYLRAYVARSKYTNKPVPERLLRLHQRIRAKLKAFLDPPSRTLRQYKEDDLGVPARYARAVAHYRRGDIDVALSLIDGLIAEHPKDPYFHELKGQILFENGRIAEALAPNEVAVRQLPDAPLLRIGLAHAQIELNRKDLLAPAITNLERALRVNRTMPLAWRLAATAYGRNGQLGRSALASAEYSLLVGRLKDADRMARRAQATLKRGSPGWLRAGDVIIAAEPKHR